MGIENWIRSCRRAFVAIENESLQKKQQTLMPKSIHGFFILKSTPISQKRIMRTQCDSEET